MQKSIRKILKIQRKVRIKCDEIKCDEKDVISALQVAFEGKIILTQYCIENKRLDAYLPKYKLEIEVDKYDHESRNPNYEQIRQLMIEGHRITVIRTNFEAPNCINRPTNQIYIHTIKSTKKQTKKSSKKSLIDDHSKSKCFKWIVKKILPNYKNE